jgi:SAM-dependent methyltransferase
LGVNRTDSSRHNSIGLPQGGDDKAVLDSGAHIVAPARSLVRYGRIDQTYLMDDISDNLPRVEPRAVGTEAGKTIEAKLLNGFVARYLSGANILDIGYRGYLHDAVPIVPQAIGIDLEYPGYDGKTLPFENESQDAVFSSHCLEHIDDYKGALREWHRVLRIGGFMLISVPHQYLYEKRPAPPSRWNVDHKRFYTPASLMSEVESALSPNTYRLRHLVDNDLGFTYWRPPEVHSGGCYEIEMVLEKIAEPSWQIIPDLINIDIGPQSDLVTWIGFGSCETAFRWTTEERASIEFWLSSEQAVAAQMANANISITADTFGKQRIQVNLNAQQLYNRTRHGDHLLLEIPARGLRQGLNILEFILPDATPPASTADQLPLGIAVRNIRFSRTSRKDEPTAEPIGKWRAIKRLLGLT